MIHYTSDGWFLAIFKGDANDSRAKELALSRGDDLSSRAGAKGQRGIHDARHCGRAPGHFGCSYVGGAHPSFVETDATEWEQRGYRWFVKGA